MIGGYHPLWANTIIGHISKHDRMPSVMSYPRSWSAVVALKPTSVAKSRLGELPAPLRQRLAGQMALDTLTALAAATDRLVVVTDAPAMARTLGQAGISAKVLVEPDPAGLNNALRAGEGFLRSNGAERVLACVGDLPALDPESIETATRLMLREGRARAFVPDHSGIGSTMLMADGVDLDPHFGGGSAAAHRDSGAVPITGPDLARLRADVDAPDDLPPAVGLGVGAHTGSLITDGRLADYTAVTVAAATQAIPTSGPAGDYRVISDAGIRFALPAAVIDPAIRFLRPGQRLHAAVGEHGVISAWI